MKIFSYYNSKKFKSEIIIAIIYAIATIINTLIITFLG